MIAVAETREQTRARYPDETGYVERDGVRVFYEVYGSGEPTFLLLPTWSIIHSRQWKAADSVPRARATASSRSTAAATAAPTARGASEAYDEREFALDALAVLDATGDRARRRRRRTRSRRSARR